MICGRCDEPIRDGEKYTTYDVIPPTGPGMVVHWHAAWCKPVPIQTTQDSVHL